MSQGRRRASSLHLGRGSRNVSTEDEWPSGELNKPNNLDQSEFLMEVGESDHGGNAQYTSSTGWSTDVASTTERVFSSEPGWGTGSAAIIHPVSDGGAVSWDDHNDLVYTKGKDRGPRPPLPTISENYKSRGPLNDFDFSKLRADTEAREQPLNEFLDKYYDEDNTPSELVKMIIAYFDENREAYLKYLIQRVIEMQAKDLEIKKLKEIIGKRDEKIERKNQKIRDRDEEIGSKEALINTLERKIEELSLPRAPRGSEGSLPAPIAKLIRSLDAVHVSLIESLVKVKIMRVETYVKTRQYSAGSTLASEAEAIVVSKLTNPVDLPTKLRPGRVLYSNDADTRLLHSRVLFWAGRAQFELQLYEEAVNSFQRAIGMGLNADSRAANGDEVAGWLDRALAEKDSRSQSDERNFGVVLGIGI